MLACLVFFYVFVISHCFQFTSRGLYRHALPVRLRTLGKADSRTLLALACNGERAALSVAQELKKKLVNIDNSAVTLRNLVQMGDEWSRSVAASTSESGLYESQFEKVSGCASAVEIKTSLHDADAKGTDQSKHIVVEGRADSRVTQGMVAALCQLFGTLSIEQALTIDAEELTNYFGFDALLPVGRQNTFLNTIRLIQSQIKRLSKGTRPSSAVGTLTESLGNSCAVAPARFELHNSLKDSSKSPSEPDGDPRAAEIAMLLSGGVDSSVALKLLLDQGHKVRAYYLKIWLEDELAHLNSCPWEEDLRYAQAVCDQVGVPLETVSLQREYWRDVVQYTLTEARAGRTPNPDIMCNSRVKFGTFYDYVGRYHKKIATGHYAQVMRRSQLSSHNPRQFPAAGLDESTAGDQSGYGIEEDEDVLLLRSPDPVKDQSYFLCNLRQEQLRRCLFPIGHLHKHEVRALAEQFNLPTKDRKDSQGICFLGKLKFDDFIEHYLGQNPGPVVCVETGEEIGEHRGLWFHTIGQRKGLGPLLWPGMVHAGPWYVTGKDVRRNTLYVSSATHCHDAEAEAKPVEPRCFNVEQVNWINGVPAGLLHREGDSQPPLLETHMKLRHSPRLVKGRIQLVKETSLHTSVSHVVVTGREEEARGDNGAKALGNMATAEDPPAAGAMEDEGRGGTAVRVEILEEGASIAPGQFAAFYDGEVCLGAGVVADLPPPVPGAAGVPMTTASSDAQNGFP